MRASDAQPQPALTGSALRRAIRESVQKFLDIERYEIFLFGSEVRGVVDRRSDIDVGILGPQPVPGAVMQHIRQELETLRTLRTFDVVDFHSVDESFKAEAREYAERL